MFFFDPIMNCEARSSNDYGEKNQIQFYRDYFRRPEKAFS